MKRLHEIQTKIRGIQEKTQTALLELKQQYENEKRAMKQKHRESMRELELCLRTSKQQLNDVTKKNIEFERKLRMEKWKVEDSVSALLTKADTDMFEMQAEYDKYAEADRIEREACDELMRKLEPLKMRADAVLEEKRLEAERQAAELAEQENMITAATTIQSLWRSWKARKTIRAEQRKTKNIKKPLY
ncbi:hypothetical protein P879_00010 [Paragonimus westermani]|uniref:Dynein regulatory complex protein 10 n=1 Tax=Paragonimus westermani TaxID=34504 RepID=A0A8T0E0E9_9TREM|nr:hypothetical protein P879_00010 [Paragonimus westermani]